MLYPSIALVAITFIIVVGKSIRISQLKKIDNSKIKSVGKYEKNSKTKSSSIYNLWSNLKDN
jgi:hypothetical protein